MDGAGVVSSPVIVLPRHGRRLHSTCMDSVPTNQETKRRRGGTTHRCAPSSHRHAFVQLGSGFKIGGGDSLFVVPVVGARRPACPSRSGALKAPDLGCAASHDSSLPFSERPSRAPSCQIVVGDSASLSAIITGIMMISDAPCQDQACLIGFQQRSWLLANKVP